MLDLYVTVAELKRETVVDRAAARYELVHRESAFGEPPSARTPGEPRTETPNGQMRPDYRTSFDDAIKTSYTDEDDPGSGRANSGRGLTPAQLRRTLEFIASAPHRDISLATMAQAAGLSPFHFSRMFKLSTGSSPHQYVLKRRLEIGAEHLANSTTPISVIADELGFADQSHFTMHFKRQHGISPGAFRRQNGS